MQACVRAPASGTATVHRRCLWRRSQQPTHIFSSSRYEFFMLIIIAAFLGGALVHKVGPYYISS